MKTCGTKRFDGQGSDLDKRVSEGQPASAFTGTEQTQWLLYLDKDNADVYAVLWLFFLEMQEEGRTRGLKSKAVKGTCKEKLRSQIDKLMLTAMFPQENIYRLAVLICIFPYPPVHHFLVL